MADQPFAYSLSHQAYGWSWRVFDADGRLVAAGASRSQAEAQTAVEAAILASAQACRVSLPAS